MISTMSKPGSEMQLNIKNREAYRLAKRLAERTGESLTEAVTKALKERLEREEASGRGEEQGAAEKLKQLREISSRFDSLPVLDDREPDEIIGYDEYGLPK
jgi:antitoxin VapB